MMDNCGCGTDDFAAIFDDRESRRARDKYRRDGPDRTTRMLLDLIKGRGVAGSTILDVGGGIGIIDQELLLAGAGHATLVDGSPSALAVARIEARRANLLDRLEMAEGDFVRLAPSIDVADIVTLDRVVCCYADAVRLVGLSAARARRLYGLVLPRDAWWIRLASRLINATFRLRRSAYRSFAHPNELVDRLAAAHGLQPVAETGTRFWRVVLYARLAPA
jgi:magnesium-protoporphyrin O-methyltransferase